MAGGRLVWRLGAIAAGGAAETASGLRGKDSGLAELPPRRATVAEVRWLGWWAVMVAAAASILWPQVAERPNGNLLVHFFDVGQGDAALITTPDVRQVLVDGGLVWIQLPPPCPLRSRQATRVWTWWCSPT